MTLKIHFLNVGHGDCTVIEHQDDRLTVIDINNGTELDLESSEELAKAYGLPIAAALERVRHELHSYNNRSPFITRVRQSIPAYERQTLDELIRKGYNIELTNPIEFLHENYPSSDVFRYIQTHPDLDHMRGLTALTQDRKLLNVWDTKHDKTPEFQRDSDEEEWATYQKFHSSQISEQEKGYSEETVVQLYRGSQGRYWNQDLSGTEGHKIEILSPTPDIVATANKEGKTNNLSYVLRLTCNGWKIILAGDAESAVWEDLVEQHGEDLKCDVLKASHHGRDSGYHQKAVELMSPQYTIVSVGKKPETDASNKYRQYSDYVWSTRWKGNITLMIDDSGKAVIDSQYNRGVAGKP